MTRFDTACKLAAWGVIYVNFEVKSEISKQTQLSRIGEWK